MLVILGLVLIIAGWIIQLYRVLAKKDMQLNPIFLGLYAIGCLLLTVNYFTEKDVVTGTLDGLSVVLPAIILATVMRLKKSIW
jgi:hypothetical protein